MRTSTDKGVLKNYLVSYRHIGREYCIEVKAASFDDARARLRCLGMNGEVEGEIAATIPYRLGWAARLLVWLRNLANAG